MQKSHKSSKGSLKNGSSQVTEKKKKRTTGKRWSSSGTSAERGKTQLASHFLVEN